MSKIPRRRFLLALGGLFIGPGAARAQPRDKVYRIGYIRTATPDALERGCPEGLARGPLAEPDPSDPIFFTARSQIVQLAMKHRLPAVYQAREFPEIGGLMSYGDNASYRFRRAAVYVDKILKGTKPGELPVEQSTKIEFVINLNTAKALGLTIPQSLLLRADEVIQ